MIFETQQNSFFLIAGPCVIEDESVPFEIAETILPICQSLDIPLIYKASYRKANRTSINSFQGIGDEKALKILADIRNQYNIPVLTDIHTAEEAKTAAPYVDVLQIPAFLCRQTDLLLAAGKIGKTLNIKKGQFLSPDAMKFVIEKVESTANKNIILTERGTFFGYHDLVVDFRNIPIMQSFGYPVVLDSTHSLQQPNGADGKSGGQPEFIETMCKSGIAAGADGLFIETHPKPQNAKSDGSNMLKTDYLKEILTKCKNIYLALQNK